MSTLTDLLKAHNFDRMECADHEGRCCPEGGCHDLRLSQYDHYAAMVADWLESEEAISSVARNLAQLEPGEDWPTNAFLGGSLTGTRDDEYRTAMHDEARDALSALAAEARKGADQ